MNVPQHRREVLSLYRSILRAARGWQAAEGPAHTGEERNYIRQEAKKCFSQHKSEQDAERVRALLEEGESRLEIALHYNNPFPRPMNFSQKYVMSSRNKSAQKRMHKQSKPVYLYSSEV